MNKNDLNLRNSLFEGFDDNEGLMICSYEWGHSKKDEELLKESNIDEYPRNEGLYILFLTKYLALVRLVKRGNKTTRLKSGWDSEVTLYPMILKTLSLSQLCKQIGVLVVIIGCPIKKGAV